MGKVLKVVSEAWSPSTTGYEKIYDLADGLDAVLDAIIIKNGDAGAIAVSVAVVESGVTVTAAHEIAYVAAAAAGSTTNLIDGFQLPLTGEQEVHVKTDTITNSHFRVF